MESAPRFSSSRTPILARRVESHFHRGFHSEKNRVSIFLLNITIRSRHRMNSEGRIVKIEGLARKALHLCGTNAPSSFVCVFGNSGSHELSETCS